MYKQSTNQSTNETIPVRKDEKRLINQASYQPVKQQTTNKQSIKEPNEKTIKQSKVNHKKNRIWRCSRSQHILEQHHRPSGK